MACQMFSYEYLSMFVQSGQYQQFSHQIHPRNNLYFIFKVNNKLHMLLQKKFLGIFIFFLWFKNILNIS